MRYEALIDGVWTACSEVRLVSPAIDTADDSPRQWERFLDELAAEFRGESFQAAQVVYLIRQATPCPFTLPDTFSDIDRQKPGELERALNRSFVKRTGIGHGDRGLHLARFRCEGDVSRWRVEVG